ncbi:GHKL domain-containing protein [Pontibacillus sp. HMF3514]|nr:GHKL domain-containing protein [Pontibacillus sp. HMF3514]
MSNFLDNAIQYYQGEDAIWIKGEFRDQYYRISITGQGQTISESEQEKIFSRFYRTDPSRSRTTGGSGLGLAISKEIVEKHDGRIWLESDGSVHSFYFEVPLY